MINGFKNLNKEFGFLVILKFVMKMWYMYYIWKLVIKKVLFYMFKILWYINY